jgi:hypothetical protein
MAILVPIVLLTCLIASFAIANAYMVLFERIPPGTPVFLDELAQPLGNSLALLLCCALIIAIALVVHRFALRKINRN